jgi:hypothetical protein
MICKVDPRHVGAVPRDYNNSKMRVSEYEVIGEVTDPDILAEISNTSVIESFGADGTPVAYSEPQASVACSASEDYDDDNYNEEDYNEEDYDDNDEGSTDDVYDETEDEGEQEREDETPPLPTKFRWTR